MTSPQRFVICIALVFHSMRNTVDVTIMARLIVMRRAKVMGNVKGKVRVQSATLTAMVKLLEKDNTNETYQDQVSYKCHPITFLFRNTS